MDKQAIINEMSNLEQNYLMLSYFQKKNKQEQRQLEIDKIKRKLLRLANKHDISYFLPKTF